jgi:hypothetical protein
MSDTNPYSADGVQLFAMSACIEAFITGAATVSDDGNEVRWPEPDCNPRVDRLVGIARCEGKWAPLVEVGSG